MSLSEEADKYIREKIQCLLENQCRIPVRSSTPIRFYYMAAKNLIDEADFNYHANRLEESFILYSRYITLFVEDLKKYHPDSLNVSVNDREYVIDVIRKQAFPRAEELKEKLKQKYALEYEETLSNSTKAEDDTKISTYGFSQPPGNIHAENEQTPQDLTTNYLQSPTVPSSASLEKPTYDRSQKPISAISSNFVAFSRIFVPSDITPKFLQIAERNTAQNVETCGILAGKKKDNGQYMITHIVVPKQNGDPNSCDTVKEEEVLEYIFSNNLITLGWIHTHPTQTAFLSSVDLHTHLPYQMLLKEAIAIVVSPKFNETGIFSLTLDTGIPVISMCQKTGFHEHITNPPLYLISSHTTYDPGLQCQIIDLR